MAKIIALQHRESDWVAACLKGNRTAQRQVYEHYAGKMLGVCLRYVRGREDAEEVLALAFVKVFARMADYRSEGSFEGWIRTIVVREALTFLRTHKNVFDALEEDRLDAPSLATTDDQHGLDALLQLVQALPTGYRTVFNLHALEGYSHQEIAVMLNISESTSKSQLFKARNTLQMWLGAQSRKEVER